MRLPGGRAISRRFREEETLRAVRLWVGSEGFLPHDGALYTTMPRRRIADAAAGALNGEGDAVTLASLGLHVSAVLVCEAADETSR